MHTSDGKAQLYCLGPTVIPSPHLDASLRLAQRNTTQHEARLQDKSKIASRIVEGVLQEAMDVQVPCAAHTLEGGQNHHRHRTKRPAAD